LAAARHEAKAAFDAADNTLAVAFRANHTRPKSGRYTKTAVADVAHIDPDTLLKFVNADDSDDHPERPEGDYSLNDFAALGAARTDAKKALDAATDEVITHWRGMQENPRTRMKMATAGKLIGIPRSTLRAWLLGTHNPYGFKRSFAKDVFARTGQRTVTLNRRATQPAPARRRKRKTD
jgi:hypothetical protein